MSDKNLKKQIENKQSELTKNERNNKIVSRHNMVNNIYF